MVTQKAAGLGTRFVSTAAAAGVMAGTHMVKGGAVVAKTAGKFALGRIAGILGGPLGFALTFVLPGLIGLLVKVIKGNKDAVEDNNKELRKSSMTPGGRSGDAIVEHAIKFADATAPIIKLMGRTGPGVPEDYTDKSASLYKEIQKIIETQKAQPLVVNINLDGEQIFTERIDEQLKKKSDYQERNIGVY